MILKVKKKALLLIAGFVWLAAGINILRIGIASLTSLLGEQSTLQSVGVLLFSTMILAGFLFMFRRIVSKHSERILNYKEEKKSVFCFFDIKGYLMMGFMMGLGIVLRHSNLLPTFFFAFFYTGLGMALSISGIRFIIRFFALR